MLIEILKKIPDPRDPQGHECYLHDVLYISSLAILANAKGYLDIHRFMTVHFESLKSALFLKWSQVPNPSAIRKIIIRVSLEDIEKVFREHAQELLNSQEPTSTSTFHLCVDGKAYEHNRYSMLSCWLTPCLGSCRNGEQRKRNTNIAEPFAYSKFKGNFCNCRCYKKLLNVQKQQAPT